MTPNPRNTWKKTKDPIDDEEEIKRYKKTRREEKIRHNPT